MSANTSIQWTDRTWNPVRGCSVISPGCVNCYAMKMAHRFSGEGRAYTGLTKQTKAGPQWTGHVRTVETALLEPLSWRKPARVFVNSMSDLFHESVPDAFIDRVFAVMACAPQHTFQILTKRPERMRAWATQGFEFQRIHEAAKALLGFHHAKRRAVNAADWPLPNVWLGVSAEDQQRADDRIPLLLQTPAAVRFVSAEPLLGPIALTGALTGHDDGDCPKSDPDCLGGDGDSHEACEYQHRIDWVIVGGESNGRPCNIEWIRGLVRQCGAAGVACFVKQLGSDARSALGFPVDGIHGKGGEPSEWPEDLRVREFPRSGVPA